MIQNTWCSPFHWFSWREPFWSTFFFSLWCRENPLDGASDSRQSLQGDFPHLLFLFLLSFSCDAREKNRIQCESYCFSLPYVTLTWIQAWNCLWLFTAFSHTSFSRSVVTVRILLWVKYCSWCASWVSFSRVLALFLLFTAGFVWQNNLSLPSVPGIEGTAWVQVFPVLFPYVSFFSLLILGIVSVERSNNKIIKTGAKTLLVQLDSEFSTSLLIPLCVFKISRPKKKPDKACVSKRKKRNTLQLLCMLQTSLESNNEACERKEREEEGERYSFLILLPFFSSFLSF